MVMYPDKFLLTVLPAGSTKDAKGNWQTSGTPTTKEYECRYEPNTGNRVIPGTGGNVINYKGILFLKTDDVFKEGATIEVIRHNGAAFKETIKGLDQRRFNTKIYV